MSAILNENQPFQGVDGHPIVNGFIFVGERNGDPTVTQIDIFADRELSIPLLNPQRTNSFGRAVNKIWVDGRFSIIVQDENQVEKFNDPDAGEVTQTGILSLTNVQGTNIITAGGVPAITGYVDKQQFTLTLVNAPTGVTTLNIDNRGPITIKNQGDDIISGLLPAGGIIVVAFNSIGPIFELVSETRLPVNSVGQSQLKTATETLSTSLSGTLLTGVGGEFTFWPRLRKSIVDSERNMVAPVTSDSVLGIQFNTSLGTAPLTRYVLGTEGATIFVENRFVQASPPYDIGDGEVHSFIFALIDSAGKIIAMSHAPDPTWANNGPTCIRPEYSRNGKSYRKHCITDPAKSFEDPDYITWVEREITADFKNSDMALIPHPFQGNDMTGKSIILIDPCDPIVLRAEEMKNAGENASEELFYKDYVRFGNEHMVGRKTPHQDVMIVKPKWKNTGL